MGDLLKGKKTCGVLLRCWDTRSLQNSSQHRFYNCLDSTGEMNIEILPHVVRCIKVSALMFLHAYIQVFPLFCHPSVWCIQYIRAAPTVCHGRWSWSWTRTVGGTPTPPASSSSLWRTAWPEKSWRKRGAGFHQLRREWEKWGGGSSVSTGSRTAHTLPPLTAVYRGSDGDVASLRVKGELVDVHPTGADHLHVLFKNDLPIARHVHVGIMRGVVLLYPETSHNVLFGEHSNWISKRWRSSWVVYLHFISLNNRIKTSYVNYT